MNPISRSVLLIVCTSPSVGIALSVAQTEGDETHISQLDSARSGGSRTPFESGADWATQRSRTLEAMQQVMGPLPRPKKPVALDVKVVEEVLQDGIIRRKFSYRTDGTDRRLQAWLLMPSRSIKSKGPAMLCLHPTATEGKDVVIGLAGTPSRHYALDLTKRGYITLSPDYPSMGENEYDFEDDDYASGSMKAIYDNMRSLDLLQSLPEVDGERIGCIGHSLGGHNGLFTAAFDERIKVIVTSCGFTGFRRYYGGDLRGWSGPRYMPRVASRYKLSPDAMPFDFPDVIAAIAPRAVFVVAPVMDDNFDVEGVREVINETRPVYKMLGATDNLRVLHPDAAHDFPAAARQAAYAFIDRQLMNAK